MTIYINWEERDVLTAEEFDASIQEQVDEAINDDSAYEEWLDEEYTASEIMRAHDENTMSNIVDAWCEYISDKIRDEARDNYEEYTFDN